MIAKNLVVFKRLKDEKSEYYGGSLKNLIFMETWWGRMVWGGNGAGVIKVVKKHIFD